MDSLKEIKSFFRELSASKTLAHSEVEEFPFDEHRYNSAIEDVRLRLRIKLSPGFCSNVMINQIARHYCGIGERFGETTEFYHGSTLLDTIELIESGKIKGEEFTKSRLIGGLYKVHHSALSQASSISMNISHGLNKQIVEAAKQKSGNSLSALLNTIHPTTIAKRERQRKLTGEWIVFAKVGSVKYYLCLATHLEGKGEAELIYNKILPAFGEFPALSRFKKD